MNIYSEFKKILTFREDLIIFELGSNNGKTIIDLIKNLNGKYTYYSFEPDIRFSDILNRLANKNSNIKLFKEAIGSKNGEFDFYVSSSKEISIDKPSPSLSGSSSIKTPSETLYKCFSRIRFHKTKVKVKTLDFFCNENNINHIDFLWMDVQGAEVDVFSGAKKTLSKIDYIYTEYDNCGFYKDSINFKRIQKVLNKYFTLYHDFGGDALFKNKKLKG